MSGVLGGLAQCYNGESQILRVTSHEFLHHFSRVLSHRHKEVDNYHPL